MTLRGAVDHVVTANLRDAGLLVSKKSFVGRDGHLYFEGADKSRLRPLVFKRHKSKCAVCGAHAPEEGEDGYRGEWNHREKCDCPTKRCSEVRCGQLVRDCHRHRTPGFHRHAEKMRAAKDFNEVQGETDEHGDSTD
jgi:hypothetical protein